MLSTKSIEDVFGITIAVTPLMLQQQRLYRSIVRGMAPWNDKDTPSLMLAGSVSAEVARKVTVGLESEIEGSSRADYLNGQYAKVKNNLRTAVIATCNGGEVVFKPYVESGGLEVTLSETDCYWPAAYNTRDELVGVVFGAIIRRGETTYRLLEHHAFNEEVQMHQITYRAFESKSVTQSIAPDDLGKPIPLTAVPEWAHLQDITISNIEQPLFVHFKLPNSDTVETPQRQGLPIFSKAISMLEKADEQEALTRREFRLGKVKVFASIELFRKPGNKKGEKSEFEFPEDKDVFVSTPGMEPEAPITTFNPELRFEPLDARMNQILRRIEFLCGLSYGIISDANVQDKTATEVQASKDRFFTTVSDIQQALQSALEHLIYSFNVLADLQGVPQGNYDISFTWDDSIMADRPREFDERVKAQAAGWLSPIENRAWWLGVDVDSEEAQNVPQVVESEF